METKVRFSGKEIAHLVISVLVMSMLVAMHMGYKTISSAITADIVAGLVVFAFYLGLSFVVIVPAFIFHEMGHKFLAQKFGFWAEYRMWTQGMLMAVLMLIIFRGSLLFLAPGAVYFAPHGFRGETKEKVGKIGLIGPVINLILGVIFGLLSLVVQSDLLTGVFSIGASANAFLAIFNLIPFAPLDGEKVFVWDKKLWGAAIGLGIVLFAVLSFNF